jgi:hypothetical protein
VAFRRTDLSVPTRREQHIFGFARFVSGLCVSAVKKFEDEDEDEDEEDE